MTRRESDELSRKNTQQIESYSHPVEKGVRKKPKGRVKSGRQMTEERERQKDRQESERRKEREETGPNCDLAGCAFGCVIFDFPLLSFWGKREESAVSERVRERRRERRREREHLS